MNEKQKLNETISEEWKDIMRRGIEEAIANYEIFEIITLTPSLYQQGRTQELGTN